MKCGSTVVNRAVKPASAYSHALISRRLVVVKIFGKYTDIGIERSIVIFVSDTKLTTRTQSHGRSGTVDEVQAAERGVARHAGGVIEVTSLYRVYTTIFLVRVERILEEDVFLLELTAGEIKVGIKIPVLISHRCTDTGIGKFRARLHRSELSVIPGGIHHHAGTHGKVEVFFLVVDLDSRIIVKILCGYRESESSGGT